MPNKNNNKYQMSQNLATTTHHPYGHRASQLPPRILISKGYAVSHNYAHVAKELQELANIEKNTSPKSSRRFSIAAEMARVKAYNHGEYERRCKHCGFKHAKMVV